LIESLAGLMVHNLYHCHSMSKTKSVTTSEAIDQEGYAIRSQGGIGVM
jgi:hypothetical protein